jgi:hypothetical protein
MFARAVPKLSLIPVLIAALALVAGCGGGDSQDAGEPEGSYRLEIVNASFPPRQSIAGKAVMRITVRNPDSSKKVPHVAVTVETAGAAPDDGPVAFAQSKSDPRLADANRPVWVLDQEPRGGTSAYSNTWSLGSLRAGETKSFEWKLTAVEAGQYSLAYRVAPGLDGNARLAAGSRARGIFKVTISDEPVPARVNDAGEVVRGEQAGALND